MRSTRYFISFMSWSISPAKKHWKPIEIISVILQVGYYKATKGPDGIGLRLFKRAPIHHHFELLGWSESKIIVRFWIASLIFALFALTTLKLR